MLNFKKRVQGIEGLTFQEICMCKSNQKPWNNRNLDFQTGGFLIAGGDQHITLDKPSETPEKNPQTSDGKSHIVSDTMMKNLTAGWQKEPGNLLFSSKLQPQFALLQIWSCMTG